MDIKTVYLKATHRNAITPRKATSFSAGYDVFACLGSKESITKYTQYNDTVSYICLSNRVRLHPNERIIIPTGWMMTCPLDHCIKIYPRSGNSIKYGLTQINAVAIIDADYQGEVKVLLHNNSEKIITINHGDRIAQMMVEKVNSIQFEEVHELPEVDSTRGNNGLGSTGQ